MNRPATQIPQHSSHRKLHFDTLAEGMAEAERLAKTETITTGKFDKGQILDHLAQAILTSTGELEPPKTPLVVRLVVRLIRNKMIHKPWKPGLKLPDTAQEFFWSKDSVPVDDALAKLRRRYESFSAKQEFPKHPLFGKLTAQQLEQLQCRHFELHLGFIHDA